MARAAGDARTARHLAAANDRDLSEVVTRIEANRVAINALGEQTAAGFAGVRAEFADVRSEMRAGFAETRAGFEAIGQRLDTLIERDGRNS